MISFNDLYGYFINNDDLRAESMNETFLYDKKTEDFVCSSKNNTCLERIKIKVFTKIGRYIEIPSISYKNLHIQFVESLNNQRLIDYMNLFGEEHRFDAAHQIIYCQDEEFFNSENGYFECFIKEQLRPIVEEWSRKNKVQIEYDYNKSECCIFDNAEKIASMKIPTDGVKINALVANVITEDMFFDKRTYCFVDSQEAGKFPYNDCVKMAYCDEEKIFDSFLDEMGLENVKKELHNSDDFCAEFRSYIDYNHNIFDKFCDYEAEYLMPIIEGWCAENSIRCR